MAPQKTNIKQKTNTKGDLVAEQIENLDEIIDSLEYVESLRP